MKELSVKQLVLMAFYVALFMVLDVLANSIPLFRMPNGGSLGISTIALLMASYQLGWRKGLIVAIVAVFCMFITGPMYTPDLAGFLLDYFIAFAAYGLASLFPNFSFKLGSSAKTELWFYSGVLITNLIRFASSTISGVVVWDVNLWGSIVYQASYMLPTTILDLILVPMLMGVFGKRFVAGK